MAAEYFPFIFVPVIINKIIYNERLSNFRRTDFPDNGEIPLHHSTRCDINYQLGKVQNILIMNHGPKLTEYPVNNDPFVNYAASIGDKHNTLRIYKQIWERKGKRMRRTERILVSEWPLKSVKVTEVERERTISYFDFGLQIETDTIKVLLFDHSQFMELYRVVLSELGLNPENVNFTSINRLTT